MFFASALAAASLVYLECQMTTSATGETPLDTPWEWEITLNEAEGWADYTNRNGSQRVKANFTAQEVRFDSFTVNRRTLIMTRHFAPLNATSYGACRLAEVKNRAF
jgi:GTP cyclohydrolase III